jgi:hypothetical protein
MNVSRDRKFLVTLLLGFSCALTSCTDEGRPAPVTAGKTASTSAVMPEKPAPQVDLVISCAHVLVRADLIRGILVVRNPGKTPVAIVDRWNSWGAYQWVLTVGGLTYSNPQMSWYENFYSETLLAPGEVRVARFVVRRGDVPWTPYSPDGTEWNFIRGFASLIVVNGVIDSTSGDFTPDQEVQVELNGGRTGPRPSYWLEKNPNAPIRWSGTLIVRSQRLESVEELESHLKGDDRTLRQLLR